MPASKIRPVDSYPLGWFQALRAALHQPEVWQYLAEHNPSPDGRGGTAKNLGNRLRSLPAALAAYPGFEPALTEALTRGKFTIRQFPGHLPGQTIFKVAYRPFVDFGELIEKALAGG